MYTEKTHSRDKQERNNTCNDDDTFPNYYNSQMMYRNTDNNTFIRYPDSDNAKYYNHFNYYYKTMNDNSESNEMHYSNKYDYRNNSSNNRHEHYNDLPLPWQQEHTISNVMERRMREEKIKELETLLEDYHKIVRIQQQTMQQRTNGRQQGEEREEEDRNNRRRLSDPIVYGQQITPTITLPPPQQSTHSICNKPSDKNSNPQNRGSNFSLDNLPPNNNYDKRENHNANYTTRNNVNNNTSQENYQTLRNTPSSSTTKRNQSSIPTLFPPTPCSDISDAPICHITNYVIKIFETSKPATNSAESQERHTKFNLFASHLIAYRRKTDSHVTRSCMQVILKL